MKRQMDRDLSAVPDLEQRIQEQRNVLQQAVALSTARYCGNCGEDRKYLVGTQEARLCKEKSVTMKVWMPLQKEDCHCKRKAAKERRQDDQLKNQQLLTVEMCFLDYLAEAQVV
ncbi:hypothetical protein NDU88_003577 [Pleurodeles waltl]|uniref:CXXC-type zinc finger protein 1 n=1 Tax=Pleurodeles waltl TaxID=8319 RepID=A0AAV7WTF5_PLEWA|nr:hypothetical protein NDU88_003577 [Pleurodeles waltl]